MNSQMIVAFAGALFFITIGTGLQAMPSSYRIPPMRQPYADQGVELDKWCYTEKQFEELRKTHSSILSSIGNLLNNHASDCAMLFGGIGGFTALFLHAWIKGQYPGIMQQFNIAALGGVVTAVLVHIVLRSAGSSLANNKVLYEAIMHDYIAKWQLHRLNAPLLLIEHFDALHNDLILNHDKFSKFDYQQTMQIIDYIVATVGLINKKK